MNTRPIGIFNYANSYRHAALTLRDAEAAGTHPHDPVLFLMNHSIELYLKSYLHARGISEVDLSRRPYGHDLLELVWSAKKRGLCPTEQTYSVIRIINQLNTQITSRYITPRIYRPIRDDVLDRAALNLHQIVGAALSRLGFTVRI